MKAKLIMLVALIAIAILVGISFIPLKELSNRSTVSVVVSSIEARHYPRKVPVVVPDGIRELIGILKSPKYDGVESEHPTDWSDFPFEEMEKPPPENLRDKARDYLKDDTIQLEARLYLLYWLSIRGGIDDDILAPWLEPEVCDELRDAPHLVLLAHILEWLGLEFYTPLHQSELPQESKSKLLPSASRLVKKAVALAPDDMLYRMWDLYVSAEEVKSEGGYKSWNDVKAEDEDRIAEQIWPYFQAYLRTRRGFLLGEPPELSSATTPEYLRSNSAANYISLALYPYLGMRESTILLAESAARREDRQRLLLVLDGVKHLTDLEPTQQMTVLLEQALLPDLFSRVSDNSPSQQLARTFKRIHDDFVESIKATHNDRIESINHANQLAAEGKYRNAARLAVAQALELQKKIDEVIASAKRSLLESPH